MGKKSPIKKRLDLLHAFVLKRTAEEDRVEPAEHPTELTRSLVRKLSKPLKRAFKEVGVGFGLDIDNGEDWPRLLLLLAWVIYGGRGPGHPRRWSKKRLRKLREDFEVLRTAHKDETEVDLCRRLIRRSESGNYNRVTNSETLRRVLQKAKQAQ